jgi:endonuclease/exonuclease/phosphatase (EEP) superfamily protein YafD
MSVVSWCALGVAIVAWVLLRLTDWHWIGTLVAFGPRWVLLVPVAMATIGAAFWRPRALVPLALAGSIIAGPVMGLCIPMPKWTHRGTHGPKLRVLTCNTWVGRADLRLERLIELEQPNVVALQEWPENKPLPAIFAEGWHVFRDQDNVLVSRLPIIASERFGYPQSPAHTLGLRCELLTSSGPVQFFAVHLRSPRTGLEAILERGWQGLADLETVIAQQRLEAAAVHDWLQTSHEAMLVAGDFNLVPDSEIYRRQFGYLQNAFSKAGRGWGGTKFTRQHNVRIDHILADTHWRFVRCEVCADVGSDHYPVIADVEFVKASPSGIEPNESASIDSKRP